MKSLNSYFRIFVLIKPFYVAQSAIQYSLNIFLLFSSSRNGHHMDGRSFGWECAKTARPLPWRHLPRKAVPLITGAENTGTQCLIHPPFTGMMVLKHSRGRCKRTCRSEVVF